MTSAFFEYVGEGPDGAELFRATEHTSGPWDGRSQHGSPPAALLGRACERLGSSTGREVTVSRFGMDLLGPIPVGDLLVRAEVIRPGRSVDLCRAELVDVTADRAVARAHVWRSPAQVAGPDNGAPTPFAGPDDGTEGAFPAHWHTGYLDAIQWSWLKGSVAESGPVVVWMRPRLPLLAGEPLTPLQRVLACVDSASGVSAELDPREWGFLNTDLTVHLTRPVEGDWVGLAARTYLGGGTAGMAHAELYDSTGLIGMSTQSLLVAAR
ncbi:MAG: thioesterase family protein [Nocardioidaceae bacterium]